MRLPEALVWMAVIGAVTFLFDRWQSGAWS